MVLVVVALAGFGLLGLLILGESLPDFWEHRRRMVALENEKLALENEKQRLALKEPEVPIKELAEAWKEVNGS